MTKTHTHLVEDDDVSTSSLYDQREEAERTRRWMKKRDARSASVARVAILVPVVFYHGGQIIDHLKDHVYPPLDPFEEKLLNRVQRLLCDTEMPRKRRKRSR